MKKKKSHRKPENDLGRATCSIRGLVEAGSWQTCVLTYIAGPAGIDDTGSIKIVCRYATDCGTPQFSDPAAPHYVTASASNQARLQLRYDVKDHRRPWGKTVQIKVLQGYLREGDRIVVGDTSGGSPGWRVQTFCEKRFELRVLVDRYATYLYEQLPKSPAFRIVAGDPVRLVAVAPTQAQKGKKFRIRIVGTAPLERIEIRNAMRVLKTVRPQFDTTGTTRLKVVWQGAEVRGRGRQVDWDGGLAIRGNQIRSYDSINFWNPDQPCRQLAAGRLAWQSLTTGGVAGVIITPDGNAGRMEVVTSQKSFGVDSGSLSARGKSFRLGGVGKRISVYRLPLHKTGEDWAGEFTPTPQMLHRGDNPIYICAVQEDGQMAWSSPIYLVC